MAVSADGFPGGSITKVIYHNFLTFDDLVFSPGPNLNVIIGPNGNGKSTVICGICLAVGGDPQVLGRSAKIGDYVKHGHQSGFVEVHIRGTNAGADLKSKILIDQARSTATYYLNDAHVSRAELRRTIATYNIQIDNPCTFLAQDKVRSFAQQDPNLLLKNTEKASSSELIDLHDTLEKLKTNGNGQADARASIQRKLGMVENELSSLEPIVKNYEERKKALEKIELLEKKQVFLEHEEHLAFLEKLKSRRKAKERELEETRKAMGPIERELRDKNSYVERTKEKVRDLATKKRNVIGRLDTALSAQQIGTKLRQAREDYERVKATRDSWESDVQMTKKEVASLSKNLAQVEAESSKAAELFKTTKKEYEEWRGKEETVLAEKRQIEKLFAKVRQNKEELERLTRKERQFAEDRQAVFENSSVSRQLRCADAWRWYKEHQSVFQHPVYVPILSMSLKDSEGAKFLENVIAQRDYLMFIFGSKEDELRLTASSFPWRIYSTVLTPDEAARGSRDTVLPEILRKYGFHHMVSELYDAPAPVKAYLNNLFKLNSIPIGGVETENRLDQVCEVVKNQYRLFLTNASRVQITQSRYGSNVSLKVDPLRRNTTWLVAHVPPASTRNSQDIEHKNVELRSLEKKATDAQKQYDVQKKEVDMAIESVRRKMADLRKQIDAPNFVRQQFRNKEVRLAAMEAHKPDLDEAKRALDECKANAVDEAIRRSREITKSLTESKNLTKTLILAKVSYAAAKKTVENLTDRMGQFKLEIEEKKAEYERCESEVDVVRHEIVASRKKLKQVVGISSTDKKRLGADEEPIFEALVADFAANSVPEDRENLRTALNRENARLVAMQDEGAKKDLDRYQELLESRDGLKKQLETASNSIEAWALEMDNVLAEWLSRLEELTAQINKNFGNFFRRLGCAGEICLQRPDDQRDIASYGIGIMVKFREGERMRHLTHQTQSGGERSVTTMLYLLALQELCPVPFRCVDEINQGMDPTNERLVFDMMVGLLSDVGNLAKTQYFLLTPKLLPGLQYGEKTMIHCIYNGGTFIQEGLDIGDDINCARLLTAQG